MTVPNEPQAAAAALDELTLRAVILAAKRHANPRQVLRALLQATEDLTLCATVAWERRRAEGTTAERLHVELAKAQFLLSQASDRADILAGRLARIEPRRRPHYSPAFRFRILQHMRKYLLSADDTAAAFLVTAQTSTTGPTRSRRSPRPPPSAPPSPPRPPSAASPPPSAISSVR